MNEPPDPLLWVRRWVDKAEGDLRNAEHTLTLAEDCPFDTVCFHAQQCAEKYLKALLVWTNKEFPKTHDLRLLLQLIAEEADLGVDAQEIVVLNRYSVEARYPGAWEPVSREESEEAVALARSVREAVRRKLPKGALSVA